VLTAAAECGFRGNGQGKCGNDSLRGLPQQEILEAEVPKKRELLALAEAVLSGYKRSQGIVSPQTLMVRTVPKRAVVVSSKFRGSTAGTVRATAEAKARNNSLQRITDSGTLKNTYAAVRSGQDEELKSLRAARAGVRVSQPSSDRVLPITIRLC